MCKFGWVICLISIVGIFGSMAPWINYPRIDTVIHGYQGDGWVFVILFLITIIFAIISYKPNNFRRNPVIISIILNTLITLLIYSKIDLFVEEKLNFNSDDPYLITVSAGSHIAYGLYLTGISSLLNSIVLIISFIQKIRNGNN